MASSQRPNRDAQTRPSRYPGERLGLPQSGPRSVGRFVRRFGALVLDWIIASLLASGLELAATGVIDSSAQARPAHQALIYGLWVGLMVIEVPILGGTLGHRITGLAVTPLRGGWPGLWRPIVRAFLLALLVPALVWDSDQRGFHDKVAGTVLVRT